MKSAIRNLLFLSIFLFSISYDSCVTGVNYDTKYKLYPESSGDCLIVYGYGYRWLRLGFAAFSAGSVIIITTLLVATGEKETKKMPSILIKE